MLTNAHVSTADVFTYLYISNDKMYLREKIQSEWQIQIMVENQYKCKSLDVLCVSAPDLGPPPLSHLQM